jgi:hypothetical protein
MADFDEKMKYPGNQNVTVDRAIAMSKSDHWNDLYLARAYPFLYARKLRYALSRHWWETFLFHYGSLGLHLVVLVCLSLLIVGGYRSLAQCNRFAAGGSVFGNQPWPNLCVMSVGSPAADFWSLNGSSASNLMPVSCGLNGYIPSQKEWEANRGYFTP